MAVDPNQVAATLQALRASRAQPVRAGGFAEFKASRPAPGRQGPKEVGGGFLSKLGASAKSFLPDALAGVGHFALSAGKTLASPVIAAKDVAADAFDDATNRRSVDWNPLNDKRADGSKISALAALEASQRRYNPAFAEVADSFRETGRNIRDPSRYVDAFNQGKILQVALGDLANVAGVSSLAGKGLTAGSGALSARAAAALEAGAPSAAGLTTATARLANAGNALSKFGTLAGKTAEYPTSWVAKRVTTGVNRASASITPQLVAKYPGLQQITPRGRAIMRSAHQLLLRNPDDLKAQVVRSGESAARRALALGGEALTDVEAGAAVGNRVQTHKVAEVIAPRIGVTAAEALDLLVPPEQRVPGHYMTQEMFDLATEIAGDVEAGRLNPAQQRMAPFEAFMDRWYARLEDQGKKGVGRHEPLVRVDDTDVSPFAEKGPSNTPVLDEFGDPVLDASGRPVTTTRSVNVQAEGVDGLTELRLPPRARLSRTSRQVADELATTPLSRHPRPPGRLDPVRERQNITKTLTPAGAFDESPSTFGELRDPTTYQPEFRPLMAQLDNVGSPAKLARAEKAVTAATRQFDEAMRRLDVESAKAERSYAGLTKAEGRLANPRTKPKTRPQLVEEVVRRKAALDEAEAKLQALHGDLPAADTARRAAIEQRNTQFDRMIAMEEMTPFALRAAGIDPKYVRQVELTPSPGVAPAGIEQPHAVWQTSGSERKRTGQSATPFSVEGQTRVIADEAFRTMQNEGFRALTVRHAATPEAVLGRGRLDQIVADVRARTENSGLDYNRELSVALRDAAAELGYEAWPQTVNELMKGKGGKAKRKHRVTIEESAAGVNLDSVFMPTGLRSAISDMLSNEAPPPFLRAMQQTNVFFKRLTLPLSLTWHVGDAISNVLFATLEGGIPPSDLLRAMRKLTELDSTDMGRAITDRLAAGSDAGSFGWDENKNWLDRIDTEAQRAEKRAQMGPVRRGLSTVASPLVKAQDAGFRLNQRINEFTRNAYKIAELEKVLSKTAGSKPISGSHIDALVQSPVDGRYPPQVERALNEVVESANKVFGTTPLSTFERRIITPIIPFYHWTKVINSFALRLARDNPARAMWIVHLGQLGAEDRELPGFLRGAFKVGDRYLPLNSLNPFADIGVALSPSGLMQSTAPWAKIGAASMGVDLRKGLDPLTHSTGLGSRGERVPLWKHPGELLGFTLNQFGPTRAAMKLAPAISVGGLDLGPGARYGSSEIIYKNGERVDPDRSLVTNIPGALGVRFPFPTVTQEDVDRMNAIEAKRKAARLSEIRRNGG